MTAWKSKAQRDRCLGLVAEGSMKQNVIDQNDADTPDIDALPERLTPPKKAKAKPVEFKIGDKVDYHGIIGGPVTESGCTVLSESWELCGTKVTQIDKVRGAVAVNALSLCVAEGA